ncbi:MAG: site-specific integrase, partial [Euryarchaeota archaeon]|nr:site-specific integrase [Euryarchaeota archaeon]
MDNKQLLERYHKEANSGKSFETVKLDTVILRRLENHVQKPLDQVTKDELVNYFDMLQKEVQPYTLCLYKQQTKKFYKWLYNYEQTQKVPELVSWIKTNHKKAYNYKTKADMLTDDELSMILRVCRTPRESALVSLLYDSAAREDEFIKIQMGDIVHEGDETFVSVNGKTGKRSIRLNWCLSYLKEYLEDYPNKNIRSTPLFVTNRGKRYSKNGLYTIVQQIVKRSKVQKHVTPHLFRHTRLTQLAREGLNEAQLRLFAGWERNSMMPEVYIHLAGEDVTNALKKLEPTVKYVDQNTVEQQVAQRMQEEKQKIHDEVLQQLLETLKDPQH